MNEQKLTRLEELELCDEFQKLSDEKKIILIAGEKILEMNEYLKGFFTRLENFSSENFNAQSFKDELMNDILSKIQSQLDLTVNFSKQDVLDLINKRYFEEISTLENKFHFTTQEAINSVSESFNEALQKVESLGLFQIQAREEIRKNQDKIYILEEELARQKEQNEALKNLIDEKIKDLQELVKEKESDLLSGFDFFDGKFETFKDLEAYISNKAKDIVEEKIEEYLLNQDSSSSFGNFLNGNDGSDFNHDSKTSKEEILKVYRTQIVTGNKLDELEKLIDKQSQQIEMLSQDRKSFIFAMVELIKNKKFNSEEFLKYLITQNKDEEVENLEKKLLKNLDNSDVNFLINNQVAEIIKDKINLENDDLGFGKVNFITDENETGIFETVETTNQYEDVEKSLNDLKELSEQNLKTEKQLNDTDLIISNLQEQLKLQMTENENLRNELFDEIAKNALYNSNDDIIKQDDNFLASNNLDEDDMKHNYYNGDVPIPGTKITRINNYRINNDMDSISYDETQEIIKNEFVTGASELNKVGDNWEKESQKIIDLENTVQRQEAEINRLKKLEESSKSDLSKEEIERLVREETSKLVVKENVGNLVDSRQKEFMNSLEQTLNQLRELSKIQAQTVADLEKQSKKLEEVEQKVKSATFKNNQIDQDNLDEIIEQKYKTKKDDEIFIDGLKKIEEERRKIDETLELERLRLLTEISLGTKKLNDLQSQSQPIVPPVNEQVLVTNKQVEPVVEPPKKGFFGRFAQSSSADQPFTVKGAPKKKRKQQIFYEIKVHTTPKLTRADIEK